MTIYSRRSWLRASVVGPVGIAAWRCAAAEGLAAEASAALADPKFAAVKALVFDTFGTVVDWRTSVTQQVQELATHKGLNIDAVKFAETWRGGYQPAMNRVRTGELPWTKARSLPRSTCPSIVDDRRFLKKGSAREQNESGLRQVHVTCESSYVMRHHVTAPLG